MGSRSKLWFVTFLTFIRFPLVLFFVVGALAYVRRFHLTWVFVLTLASLITSAVTDLLDGYFARRFKVETKFGAHADPLMDKLFYLTTLPLLVFVVTENGHVRHGLFLLCMTVFFLARDQWVTFLRSIGSIYNVGGGAMWSGKLRTCINFPLICAIYYYEESPLRPLPDVRLLYAFEMLACVVNVISLYTYTRRYWPYLHRSASGDTGDETPAATAEVSPFAAKRQGLLTMATGVAHDFNNFLAAILGNAGVILKSAVPKTPARTGAEQLESTAQQAIELTEKIQIYTGRNPVDPLPTDISAVVSSVLEELDKDTPEGVVVESRLDGGLPAAAVDPQQLTELIGYLVANASEAIVEGSGTITLATAALSPDELPQDAAWFDAPPADDACVVLRVTDTGCGIAPKILPNIFDPFFSTKMRAQGMGLPVVLGILRAHGGAVAVESELGKGATFTVALPVADDPQQISAP